MIEMTCGVNDDTMMIGWGMCLTVTTMMMAQWCVHVLARVCSGTVYVSTQIRYIRLVIHITRRMLLCAQVFSSVLSFG